MPDAITELWEFTDVLVELLENNAGVLGLNFVGAYGEERIPRYPAAVVTPNIRTKELHATSTFNITASLYVYVYHADLTETKRERSKADLELVQAIEEKLESDYTLGERIIFGYVTDQQPGLIQPRAVKSRIVICTRLAWEGLVQRRFE